jgi:hypothetical protein
MIINREEKSMGRYPFVLFLVSLDLTYGQNISSKVLNHFERFPRQTIAECSETFLNFRTLLEKKLANLALFRQVLAYSTNFFSSGLQRMNRQTNCRLV